MDYAADLACLGSSAAAQLLSSRFIASMTGVNAPESTCKSGLPQNITQTLTRRMPSSKARSLAVRCSNIYMAADSLARWTLAEATRPEWVDGAGRD